jgi:hypothetical protein
MKIKKEYSLRYDLDDILIVQHLADGTEKEITSISQSAAMAWEGIERGVSRQTIVAGIVGEFDGADEALVAQDLDALMAQLVALGYAEE